MKIIIFGSNGMLGRYLSCYLSESFDIVALQRQDYDLSNLDYSTLFQLLQNKNVHANDIIINAAGVIPQSKHQRDLNNRLYFTINSLFPVILSSICQQLKVKMIHITTDCVFSGLKGNYNEQDKHDETNDYGLSKSLGEMGPATIIRTSIIGEELANQRSLLEWVRSEKGCQIYGYTNHLWNGVTCLQLTEIIKQIIDQKLFWTGVRHIFSPRSVSKFQLIKMINQIYNLEIQILEFKTNQSIDKTLGTIYETNQQFEIPDLFTQIVMMKVYKLK